LKLKVAYESEEKLEVKAGEEPKVKMTVAAEDEIAPTAY